MPDYSDHRLAALLASLPPAPPAAVARAQRIPLEHAALREVVARAETDAAFRTELTTNLEAALERSGYGGDPALLATLRGHLRQDDA